MLVAGYGSDSGGSDKEDDDPFDKPPVVRAQPAPAAARQSYSDEESDEDETPAAPDVAPWLRPGTNPSAQQPSVSLLPDPLDALKEGKTPDFLNPDATKPIAELHRAERMLQKWQEEPMDTQTARVELESNKRKAMDAGGLLSRKAVLHRDRPQETEEGINTAAVDPLALAMLGASASSGRAMTQPEKKLKKSVVLGTGEKGLVKENEKKKRMMAQNGRDSNVWKSEEEMILRQQFDS